MPDPITAYPLCWPAGYGRRPADKRAFGQFRTRHEERGNDVNYRRVTVAEARDLLQDELDRIGASPFMQAHERFMVWRSRT